MSIKEIRFSLDSVYNDKKIADMTNGEKAALVMNFNLKGTRCIIEGFNDLKYLGYANGWEEIPQCVKEAREKGYEITERIVGRCETEVICKEGGWYYKVDSSD